MSAFRTCPTCRANIASAAEACPHCGHSFKPKQSVAGGVFMGLIAFFILLPICIGAFILFSGAFMVGCEHAEKQRAEESEREARSVANAAAAKQLIAEQTRAEEERRAAESSPEWIAASERTNAELRRITRENQQRFEEVTAREREERERPQRERLARLITNQLRNASNGFAYAQYEIGLRYLQGDGVKTNREAALHWLSAACTNGYSQASNTLTKLRSL